MKWIVMHRDPFSNALIAKEYVADSVISLIDLFFDDVSLSSNYILSITRSN